MKKFFLLIISCSFCFFFGFSVNFVQGSEEEIDVVVENKVLPDSPWYIAKQIWEKLVDVFVVGSYNQAIRDLKLAQERLFETEYLVNKINESDLIDEKDKESLKDSLESFKTRIQRSKERIETVKNSQTFNNNYKTIEDNLSKQKQFFTNLINKTPTDLQDTVKKYSQYLENYSESLKNFQFNFLDKLNEISEQIKQNEKKD